MEGSMKDMRHAVDVFPPFKRWRARQSLLGGYEEEFPANDIPCGKNLIYSS